MSLDEASRGGTKGDDQIGRSLSIERLEIFNKFGLGGLVTIPSRDERIFLNVQRPRRLSVQFVADVPAPCGPLLEVLAIRIKEHDCFRLSGRPARLRLSGSPAN